MRPYTIEEKEAVEILSKLAPKNYLWGPVVMIPLFASQTWGDPTWVGLGALMCAAITFSIWAVTHNALKKSYRQQSDYHHPMKVTFDKKSLTFETKNGYYRQPWNEIQKFKNLKSHIVIYRNANSISIIKKSAFEDSDEKLAFLNHLLKTD